MNQLTVLKFHTHPVRILPKDDGLSFWVVGKDVAEILGHSSASDALKRVPDKCKGMTKVPTPSGDQDMLCIDEAGLYRLVLRSNKPEAEPFMEWITAEVLPSIRRTGGYGVAGNQEWALEDEIRALKDENAALKEELLILYRRKYFAANAQQVGRDRQRLMGGVL